MKKQPKGGVKLWTDKSISEFDITGLKRYTHFEDHHGDFITKSGYKIDNYNLEQPNETYGNDRYRTNKVVAAGSKQPRVSMIKKDLMRKSQKI